MIAQNTESDDEDQGGMGALFTNPRHLTSDIHLVGRSVKRRWPIKNKQVIVNRLIEIAKKTTVSVPTKDGVVDVESAADKNAIAAAKVLAQMESQNQADEHHAEGETVKHEHSVIVDLRRDRLSAISSRLGTAGVAGLAIDVTSEPTTGDH